MINKFRVYHKASKKYIDPSCGLFVSESGELCVPDAYKDSLVVEAFAQFSDKDNREVFKGDILAGVNGSINGEDWEWGPFEVKFDEEKRTFDIPLFGTFENQNSTHWFKVIGTIHDKEA
ncbi:MAG: hypothetical protein DRH97_00370 [Chloroflexi bacterium]|nr:MAG: hypothetical protein DRH97_00370 [Chloroflexota bacterium]